MVFGILPLLLAVVVYQRTAAYERGEGRLFAGLPALGWAVATAFVFPVGIAALLATRGYRSESSSGRLWRIAGVAFMLPVGLMLMAVAYMDYSGAARPSTTADLVTGGIGLGLVAGSAALLLGIRSGGAASSAPVPRSVI